MGDTQAGQAEAAAEDSEQHSSESDLTPSGRFQQQQVPFHPVSVTCRGM